MQRGDQTHMPRAALPKEMPSTYAVVFWVAFTVSTFLVVGQIAFILSLTPIVLGIVAHSGAELPTALAFAKAIGPVGLFFLFAVGDALVFAFFARLARRHWIGLLFVPSILYLAGAIGALWIYAAELVVQR